MKKRRRKRARKTTEPRNAGYGLTRGRNVSFNDIKEQFKRAPPPPLGSLISAVGSGVVGSVLSSIAVGQRWVSPYVASGFMLGLGSLAGYFGGGYMRIAGSSLAAAGAGQLSLALIASSAFRKASSSTAAPAIAQSTSPPPAPPKALPAPRSASDGGPVLDLFRDASNDLDALDREEWRYARDAGGYDEEDWQYGTHDADPRNYVEIDLDDAA